MDPTDRQLAKPSTAPSETFSLRSAIRRTPSTPPDAH
jgi:hypothetical protein